MHDFFESTGGAEAVATDLVGVANAGACRPSINVRPDDAHGLWLAAVPAAFAIASKYLFTVGGRHVYNPALFGVVVSHRDL
jgi:hypothetical protein